jgi:hypothetical protein
MNTQALKDTARMLVAGDKSLLAMDESNPKGRVNNLAVFFGYLDVTCREFQETAQRDRKHRLFLLLAAFSQIVYATLGFIKYKEVEYAVR